MTGLKNDHACKMGLRQDDSEPWLQQKYGNDKLVSPFEVSYEFNYREFDDLEQPRLTYEYMMHQKSPQKTIFERRFKKREVVLLDPKTYKGTGSITENASEVYVINGKATKADGNFINEFAFYQLGKSTIFFGSYPQNADNLAHLTFNNIKAVISLQTEEEMNTQDTTWEMQLQQLKNHEIYLAKNIPINEFDREQYANSLVQVAQLINNVVQNKHKAVFVFSTSGISRAATAIMAYISFFKQVPDYEELT